MVRINVRLILTLLIGAALAAGATHALHVFQLERVAAKLLAVADRAEASGDARRAEETLKDYLRFKPDDRAALIRCGMLMIRSASTAAEKGHAAEVLERALRLAPEDTTARRALADHFMDPEVDRLEEALGHLEILLQANPRDGEIEARLARCLERERRYEEASRHYASAIKLAPARLDSYVRCARMLRLHMDNPAEADAIMDAKGRSGGIVAGNPNNFRAYIERSIYRRDFRIDGVADDARVALELAPGDADAILGMAQVEVEAAAVDAARRLLGDGVKRHPDDGRMYEAMANVELAAGRPREAEDALRRGADVLKDDEGKLRLLWSLAGVLLEEDRGPEVRAVIGRMKEGRINPEFMDYLEAQVLMGERKWLEAALLLEEALPRLNRRRDLAYRADLLLGRCYEQIGDLERRLAAYARAVALDPLALAGKVGQADALAESGRIDEAMEIHGRIADAHPRSRVDMARLSLLRAMRRPESKRDWGEIDKVLDAATKVAPDAPEVAVLRAEAMIAQGRRDEAGVLLRGARDAHPDRVEYWVALAEFDARSDAPESSLKTLAEAKAKLGDRVEFRLAAAHYWATRKGAEAVSAMNLLGEDLGGLPAADRVRLLRGLAADHELAGDAAGAARVIAKLVRLQPRDLGLRIAMFDATIAAGDVDSAARMVEDMKAIEGPGGTFWRFGKAGLIVAGARRAAPGRPADPSAVDEARSLLDQIVERRPSWARSFEARGEVNLLADRPEQAIKDFLHAMELGGRNPSMIRKAVQILYDQRRYDQAEALFRKVKEQGIEFDDPATRKLEAQLSLQTKDPARAIDLARRSVSTDSKDPRDHAWLGQMLLAGGKADEAEVELRKSLELDPKFAPSYVSLVRCLVGAGRVDKADAVIAKAKASIPEDLAPLPLAACLTAIGRLDEADAQYREALKREPDDIATLRAAASFGLATNRIEPAKADLRRIIGLKSKGADDADWARRMLAIILAGSSNLKSKIEALQLLGLADGQDLDEATGDASIEELRARARVLASMGDRARRRAAMRILERLAQLNALGVEDRFMLATLARKSGSWPQYNAQIITLLAEQTANPGVLVSHIRALLRHGDAAEAGRWLAKLEAVEKGSTRAVELRARLLHAEGKTDEAAELLVKLAEGADNRILPVAGVLEEIGRPARAEPLYDRFAEETKLPQASLYKAAFLGRQGRLSAALDLCEAARKDCPPDQVALIVVAAVYGSPIDDRQAERAAQIVESSAKGRPPTAESLYHMANLRSHQGRYPEAEALYRRSIAMDPQNTGPMNNLAWLLARTGKNLEEASQLVERTMALTGAVPDVLDTRGVVRIAQDQVEEALLDLEEAVAESDTAATAMLVHLAEARLRTRDRKAARATVRDVKAARLGASILHPLDALAFGRVTEELARPEDQ